MSGSNAFDESPRSSVGTSNLDFGGYDAVDGLENGFSDSAPEDWGMLGNLYLCMALTLLARKVITYGQLQSAIEHG